MKLNKPTALVSVAVKRFEVTVRGVLALVYVIAMIGVGVVGVVSVERSKEIAILARTLRVDGV